MRTEVNLEDNSEDVRIGRVLHEIRAKDNKDAEIKYENIVLDKVTSRYVEEYKKSDADTRSSTNATTILFKTVTR